MNDVFTRSCYKMLIKDLRSSLWTVDDFWQLKITSDNNHSAKVKFKTVWLQGIIQDVLDDDALLITDDTGVAKICKCSNVPGDNDWIKKGLYCSVVGNFTKQLEKPEIEAVKITKLPDGSLHSQMWVEEVEELKLFLTRKAQPNVAKIQNVS